MFKYTNTLTDTDWQGKFVALRESDVNSCMVTLCTQPVLTPKSSHLDA